MKKNLFKMKIDNEHYCEDCGKPLSLYEYYNYRYKCEKCYNHEYDEEGDL